MSEIFSEKNMMQILGKYLPDGETLEAGVHGIGLEVRISQIFKNCIITEDTILPSENGEMFQVNKGKVAKFDVYIGITENYLILSQCEINKWYYEISEIQDSAQKNATEISSGISLRDVGTCFPLEDMQSCEIKKVWMGAVNCTITMKNGSFLKLQLPKRGGLGGGMPHHAEYRETILTRLGFLDS